MSSTSASTSSHTAAGGLYPEAPPPFHARLTVRNGRIDTEADTARLPFDRTLAISSTMARRFGERGANGLVRYLTTADEISLDA
jgi:hypothetical protein